MELSNLFKRLLYKYKRWQEIHENRNFVIRKVDGIISVMESVLNDKA